MACCGDSITANYGYPEMLAGMVGKTTVNLGTSGATTGNGLSAVRDALANYQPGYVLILYGVNDVNSHGDLDAAAANIGAMIRQVRANGAVAIVGTVMPVYGDYAANQDRVDSLNRRIRNVASQEGASVAALDSAFAGKPGLIGGDGLHPTAEGSETIARTFAGKL